MDKLFLIDGHSLIFRMYYAFLRRPMINTKGEDTSILFGFTKYLLELIRREQPTHLAVMFDPPAKTFRHELDPQYKATRSATPELIKAALSPLISIIEALGIPVLMKPGYEADDVIGTVAKACASPECQVYMVTPDKDLGQIVDENIFQYKPGKSGADNEVVSRQTLCEHYGISDPKQIIDILTLWGDSADNVKGVSGIGEVGARKLVSKYGSLEGIYERLGELSEKQQQAFRDALDHIELSKALVTIKTDVPVEYTFEELRLTEPDGPEVVRLFDHFEFNSLKPLLPDIQLPEEPEALRIELKEVPLTKIAATARKEGRIAVRLSSDGDSFIFGTAEAYAIADRSLAAGLLDDDKIVKAGFAMKDIPCRGDIADIELMHYLLNPERTHKLDILASSYLNMDINGGRPAKKEEPQQIFDLFSAPVDGQTEDTEDNILQANECAAIWKLEPILRAELEKEGLTKLYRELEMPLVKVLAEMENSGVRIDTAQLQAYSRELTAELNVIEDEARSLAGEPGLNLSSPKQLGVLLYEKFNLNPKIKKSRTAGYPTDEETLREMESLHPIIGKILEFRALKKLISTYLNPLPDLINPKTGKIHTTFNQALTATGRLSSTKPNLQNIPIRTERGSKIRESFIPSDPEGFIISADYSQIELRIMAHLSGDPDLIAGFSHGADVHRATAAKIFGKAPEDVTAEERRRAKVANFGIIYGISAFGLAQRMEIPRSEAKSFIEEYFRNYPGVKAYIDKAVATAKEKGYVETIFGRRRMLPDINSKNQNVRGLAERNAVNAPVQGSAADIIKLAMINVSRRLREGGFKSRMVLQVHDELIFDVVPQERDAIMELVRQEMEGVVSLSVPLTVECNYGKNWKEAH